MDKPEVTKGYDNSDGANKGVLTAFPTAMTEVATTVKPMAYPMHSTTIQSKAFTTT
jgi:hypothetical protein